MGKVMEHDKQGDDVIGNYDERKVPAKEIFEKTTTYTFPGVAGNWVKITLRIDVD